MKTFSKQSDQIISLFNKKRLLILNAIYKCSGDTCNCDLVENLDIPKSLVSYHIKALLEMKLIYEIKCGKRKKYLILKNQIDKVKIILDLVGLI